MKLLRFMAAPLMALACYSAAALAQTAPPAPDPQVVTIPWGDTLAQFADVAIGGAMLAIAWFARKLPASIAQMLTTQQAEQVLKRAVEYGINSVAGAVKGKTLSVEVGNDVVRQALQYVVNHAPGFLVRWLGGESAIREKIIARLDIAEEVKVVPSPDGAKLAAGPTPTSQRRY